MWMAELITDKGIGNGMSILIFTSICSSFLPQLWNVGIKGQWVQFGIVVAVIIFILIFVDYVELMQRRIPVQYTRRMIGRKMYGGTSTYLPIKVNMAGVIPPIFASSILALPTHHEYLVYCPLLADDHILYFLLYRHYFQYG